jgi:hypothetical protein
MLKRAQAPSTPAPALPWLGLFAFLVLLLSLTTARVALAGGCFKPVYYTALFQPIAQEAKGADKRLLGLSDHIAVKGEDPHGGGSGCMCGINNGKWDQVLLNNSLSEPGLAPVSFKLMGVHIEYFEKDGKRKGKAVDIPAAKIAGCWNLGLATQGYTPFNAGSGKSTSAQILEPGENLLSCLCLGPENRGGAGHAWTGVSFQPMVYVEPLKDGSQTLDLAPGAGQYFALNAGASPPEIKLENAAGVKLYTREQDKGWSDELSKWKEREDQNAGLAPSKAYWILIRAGKAKASPKLIAAQAGKPAEAGFIKAGPVGKRSFKTFILCGFEPSAKGGKAQAPAYDWTSCCNEPGK